MDQAFVEDGSRVITPEAFHFVFRRELKRAVRAQNFLTLVQLACSPVVGPELARLVGADVRETDLVSEDEQGCVWALLLDTDLRNARFVVERLAARFRHYEFSTPLAIEVGAACCPTHGTDVDTLKRAAQRRKGRIATGYP